MYPAARFPNASRFLTRDVYTRVHQRLNETGCVKRLRLPREPGVGPGRVTLEERIIAVARENPQISTCDIAEEQQITQTRVWRVLNGVEIISMLFSRAGPVDWAR